MGQLREVVPGTGHFHKIVQDVHGVKLQALGLVHGAQDVLCSRNTANRQPGQAGGERGGEKVYAALTVFSRLGAALQKREPQFENKKKGGRETINR